MDNKAELIGLTADVVAAYVGNNPVSQTDIPKLIGEIYRAFSTVAENQLELPAQTDLKPAVPVKKSITPDYLICLEDGKNFKSLKRHLRTHYNLSPEQYREKWGLPSNYPMVAPNYAQTRSGLAKRLGLGQRRQA